MTGRDYASLSHSLRLHIARMLNHYNPSDNIVYDAINIAFVSKDRLLQIIDRAKSRTCVCGTCAVLIKIADSEDW